jgi:PAS domain S-box-containing protein
MSSAEQDCRRASGQEAGAPTASARSPRLLLIEPHDSSLFTRIARAAAQVELPVQQLDLPVPELPPGGIVGIGPSADNPMQIARDVRHLARHVLLVFFVDSKSRRDALFAELVRDPFICERFEMIELTKDPRQLATRIAQVGARVDRARHRPVIASRTRRRSQARATSEITERFLADVVAQANDAILTVDASGSVLTWNDAAERLLGYSADRMVGQMLSVLDPAEHDQQLRQLSQKALRSKAPTEGSVVVRRADGSELGLAVTLAPVADDRGDVAGLVMVARDNSAHVRAEEALRDANRQKDEFLAIMSHELRTPLTSILGYTDMLLRGLGGQLPDRSQKYVGNVRAAGDRLLELVNGLLDYTRLESGAERLDMAAVDLRALVCQVVERLMESARSKGLELSAGVAGKPMLVNGDNEKLRHVLRSYLNNATKFTPDGGSVHVELAADPNDAGMARVSVSDSGIGMRNEQLSRVWERFYQGDASLTRPYGGMGLGLSIARHLVQLHGGRVGAESGGPGQGSTFWFSLPLIR